MPLLTIATRTINAGIAITLHTRVKMVGVIPTCISTNPDCLFANSISIVLWTSFAQSKSVPGKFACTKRLLKLSAEAIVIDQIALLWARYATFSFPNQTACFSWCVARRFSSFKRWKNQLKSSKEMSFVLEAFVRDLSVSVSKCEEKLMEIDARCRNRKHVVEFWSSFLEINSQQNFFCW